MNTVLHKPPATEHSGIAPAVAEAGVTSSGVTPPVVTKPVDWKLIWAQRGFRYFFFAMLIRCSAAA